MSHVLITRNQVAMVGFGQGLDAPKLPVADSVPLAKSKLDSGSGEVAANSSAISATATVNELRQQAWIVNNAGDTKTANNKALYVRFHPTELALPDGSNADAYLPPGAPPLFRTPCVAGERVSVVNANITTA